MCLKGEVEDDAEVVINTRNFHKHDWFLCYTENAPIIQLSVLTSGAAGTYFADSARLQLSLRGVPCLLAYGKQFQECCNLFKIRLALTIFSDRHVSLAKT